MELSDTLWKQKWSPTPYNRIVEGPIVGQAGRTPAPPKCGCDDEPISSLWCACLAEGIGARYGEELRVLDYGCGYGRFFNFLTGRLRDFLYYGLEIPGSATGHGEQCLRFAKSAFGADGRGKFGFSGSPLEEEAIREAQVVLFGSLFPHVPFGRFDQLISKVTPVVEKGGAVVFSMLLGEHYDCVGPGYLLEMDDQFCQEVRYTRRQLLDYFDGKKLRLTETGYFEAPLEKQPTHSKGGVRQNIFRVEGGARAAETSFSSQ